MKFAVHVNHLAHQVTHGEAVRAGLMRHGHDVVFAPTNEPVPCDVAVIWGWKQHRVIESGVPCLVMERGYIGDRMAYTSMGWNGLNGRATFPVIDDGSRLDRLWPGIVQPERDDAGDVVLVCGQVRGDSSIRGVDFSAWLTMALAGAECFGLPVLYRPHPMMLQKHAPDFVRESVPRSTLPLADDLARAYAVVVYNSNSGVDAALADVPVIAWDEGAMAWPVASQRQWACVRGDRLAWAEALAWCQWSLDEIAAGEFWPLLSEVMPE